MRRTTKMNSVKDEIKLDTKLVGSIEGTFYIPSFQRGFRWGKEEVIRLLDDINSIEKASKGSYCLQPVVVKRKGDSFELIDGQQRLTTLFLIYKYMNISSGGFLEEPKFSLIYETRDKTEEFLASIDKNLKEDNIDFWFICNAYQNIEEWFGARDKKSTLTNINTYFDESVKIIWYEVAESEDAIALFTRLNIGKIDLTNAELVKAMFLSRDNESDMDAKKQEEISLQWDNIERELHNSSFWYFLTNHSTKQYQTRIDLILNLISDKPVNNKEKNFTFFYFDMLSQDKKLSEIWKNIQHTFLILKDWYENHELYHKIGYLIASDTKSLQEIYELAKNKKAGKGITKTEFKTKLNTYIKESIEISNNYSELSYEKNADYAKISKLLLLFNVESVRQNGEQSQWFPFEKIKYQEKGKVSWSLEHIHAQQSQGMRKQSDWKEWLRLHIPSVVAISEGNDELIERMQRAYDKERLDRLEFEDLQEKAIQRLSVQGNTEYMHSISNLALLNTSNNAALSNATFDVKRNEIIKIDKKGQFIPFCTKMVFLKYYTPSASSQLHFWGEEDRAAYIDAINSTLKCYLSEKISRVEEQE